MVLQDSWDPDESMKEATESDNPVGILSVACPGRGTDGTEGVMIGAQGFGVTESSEKKQEAFDFA